jgi:hypothetical protein
VDPSLVRCRPAPAPHSSAAQQSDVQFHIYGVKGDDRVTEMYSNNSEESVDQAVDAMLPNKISFVEGHGGRYTRFAAITSPATFHRSMEGTFLRHDIGALRGSSGSLLLDKDYRVIGIEVGVDLDRDQAGEPIVTARCSNFALTWGGDLSFFVRMLILELFTAKEDEEIFKAWQDIC